MLAFRAPVRSALSAGSLPIWDSSCLTSPCLRRLSPNACDASGCRNSLQVAEPRRKVWTLGSDLAQSDLGGSRAAEQGLLIFRHQTFDALGWRRRGGVVDVLGGLETITYCLE